MIQFNLDLKCPTCGQTIRPRLMVTGPVRRAILDIVSRRPDGITAEEIANIVYATDPNGGSGSNSIRVIIHKANKQLRPQGYEIKALWKGRGACFTLRSLHADPVSKPARNQNAAGLDERPQSAGTAGLY